MDALDARNISYEVVDVSAPENFEMRDFMREKAVPKKGQTNPLPPQIFMDEEYLGVRSIQSLCCCKPRSYSAIHLLLCFIILGP